MALKFLATRGCHFGRLDGPLSMDLVITIFKLKLYFNYVQFQINPFCLNLFAKFKKNLKSEKKTYITDI